MTGQSPITRTTIREIVRKERDRVLGLYRSVERRIGALEAALRVEPAANGDQILDLCREHGFGGEPEELLDWIGEILSSRA